MVLIYEATALYISPSGFHLHFHMILLLPCSVFELKCLQFVLMHILPLTVNAQSNRYSSILPGYWKIKYILALLLSRLSTCVCLQLMETCIHTAPSQVHRKLGMGSTSQNQALEAVSTFLQWTDYERTLLQGKQNSWADSLNVSSL